MSIASLIEPGIGSFGDIATMLEDGLVPYPVPNQAGYSQTLCTTTSFVGDSLIQGSNPAVQVGDYIYASLVTSPSGYAVTVNGDGTYQIACGGDSSRQSFQYEIFRIASYTLDGPATEWVNAFAVEPVWSNSLNLQSVPTGVPLSINLAQPFYATSPAGDTLIFALGGGSLPPGLSLSSAGLLSGTPTGNGSFFTFLIIATDSANLSTISPACSITLAVPGTGNIIYPPPIVTTFRNIPKARPSTRIIDDRSLVFALSGAEQPYPVYRFSGNRDKWEFPGHNPFAGL